jgi:probable HAF family extracellular repeat protein
MVTLRARILGCLATLAAATLPSPAWAGGGISIINVVNSGGYQFTNFDGPTPNSGGTTINGISNTGSVVGFTVGADGNFYNFTANPLQSTMATALNLTGLPFAMANGINSAGAIVGTDGNGNAFYLNGTTYIPFAPNGGTPAVAFGINDVGQIVGQYTSGTTSPGFAMSGTSLTTINAPLGPNIVNAQGINNNGQVVGFYVGNDGQDHGFQFQLSSANNGVGTGTAIADPTIPPVAGEPGATFVFSQILGINDHGIAVGYYGDSTTSQHGFIYNTNTGTYTFLDDPNEGFNNGVEVTQITGINNSGEITGFYTDASGLAHGFVAQFSVPEPNSMALFGIGLSAALAYLGTRRRWSASGVLEGGRKLG